MNTYTEHKLTDAMLRRLSKISKGRYCGGVSVFALRDRGLVEFDESSTYDARITEAGSTALKQARREGW